MIYLILDFKDLMKLYKDYTKEPFSFLANYTTSRSDNPLRFRKNLLQNDNKIKQNKAQYNLDRQTATISPLLSRNVGKYKFLTDEDVLLEKDLLQKAANIKRFEYPPLGKDLKMQTSIAK